MKYGNTHLLRKRMTPANVNVHRIPIIHNAANSGKGRVNQLFALVQCSFGDLVGWQRAGITQN